MPSLFTAAHLKLSLLLSVLGALVALVFTIISDSGVVAIIFRPLVSGLLMFLLGTALYTLLAKKVPEAIEAIEAPPADISDMPPSEDFPEGETGGSELALENEEYAGEGGRMDAYNSDGGPASTGSSIPRKTGVQIGKDEITVNGVKFKNQPEVMAETIKQLMDQDDA
ncbi:MAG: hypothetical protein ACOY5B_08925 [Spirochaetota bacterium]